MHDHRKQWGKGQLGREMHHKIVLYHVAVMWAENDEKRERERGVGGLVI